ncbi:MAG: hypothetical protein BWX80_02906 [Candidatus Hydrogenedentes bacterium ADurb.Bin101]|nr:MAG: hypothetical protein BWX80_02906 [Candidatus Hydrogenedentes bacterium ADurb.Bin101]
MTRAVCPVVHLQQFTGVVIGIGHRTLNPVVDGFFLVQQAGSLRMGIGDGFKNEVGAGVVAFFGSGAVDQPAAVVIVPDMDRPEVTGPPKSTPGAATDAADLTAVIISVLGILSFSVRGFCQPAMVIIFIHGEGVFQVVPKRHPYACQQSPVVIRVPGRHVVEIRLFFEVTQFIVFKGLYPSLAGNYLFLVVHGIVLIKRFTAHGVCLAL